MTSGPSRTRSGHTGPDSGTRVLFVSHLPGRRGDGPDVSQGRFGDDIEVVDFASLDAELLRSFDPHFVVSPILTPGFDIIDLGVKLWQLRYGGAYRVLTDTPLPNPGIVLREVRAHCPGLDIDLISRDAFRP